MSGANDIKKAKRISSAASNMSVLVDDMVKKALKSFKATGSPDLDAKFLKESIGALRELYGLMRDCDGESSDCDGVVIRIEKQLEEWSR